MSAEETMENKDNVVEINDRKENDENQFPELPHLTGIELLEFKLYESEMSKRIVLVGHSNLAINLENAEHIIRINKLVTIRDSQQTDMNEYRKRYEDFNKELAEKYGIKDHHKMTIDDQTGLLRDLSVP